MADEVFVIIGSTGEYSDRYEKVIGHVLTEDAAQEAVTRAECEKAKGIRPPYPSRESTHAMHGPNGEWFMGYILDAPKDYKFSPLPDAEEIERRNEAAIAQWEKECRALPLIDPVGPMESYYYEVAPAIAMETGTAIDSEAGVVAKP